MKNYIALLRKKYNLRQSELAKILSVSQQTISNWETEHSDIDNSSLIQISEKFNISIDWILTGKEHNLTDDEMDMVSVYRSLTDQQRKSIHEIIKSFKQKE